MNASTQLTTILAVMLGLAVLVLFGNLICNRLSQSQANAALFQAVYANDIGQAQAALSAGADINATWWTDDFTPLVEAVGNDRVGMVQFLLQHGAIVEIGGDRGASTLSEARASHKSKVRSMLEVALKEELGTARSRTNLV